MQPPSFPIEPLVTNKTVEICRESWGQVKLQVRRLHTRLALYRLKCVLTDIR
jgi:hypothetical protein